MVYLHLIKHVKFTTADFINIMEDFKEKYRKALIEEEKEELLRRLEESEKQSEKNEKLLKELEELSKKLEKEELFDKMEKDY